MCAWIDRFIAHSTIACMCERINTNRSTGQIENDWVYTIMILWGKITCGELK